MSSPALKSPAQLSQEIWDQIMSSLSSLSAINAATVFGRPLRFAEQEGHGRIWKSIFKEDSWASKITGQGIDIILIGSNLHIEYNKISDEQVTPNFMVFHFRNRQHYEILDPSLFFMCLEQHEYNPHTKEAIFANGGVLDIKEVFLRPEWHQISPDPARLFSVNGDHFQSYYVFWNDAKHDLKELGSKNVVGSGGPVLSMDQVICICGLQLEHPLGSGFQATFIRQNLEDYEEEIGRKVSKCTTCRQVPEGEKTCGWKLIST